MMLIGLKKYCHLMNILTEGWSFLELHGEIRSSLTDLTVLVARLLLPTLEAEQKDGTREDVEEEGEADPEGGQEHRADGVGASKGGNVCCF